MIDNDVARRTLYVQGFNPRTITKNLMNELFSQGGPIVNITLFETHAYILFEDEQSVAYCLALFNEIELHGRMLRISPRVKSKSAYDYLKYLKNVRDKLRTEFANIKPPNLPPKKMPLKQNKTPQVPKETKINHRTGDRSFDHYKKSQTQTKSKNKNFERSKSRGKAKATKHRPRPKTKSKKIK